MWRSHSLLWLISWISCALLQEIMKAAKAFQVRAQDISPPLFLLFLKFSWEGKSTELWHTMNCSFTNKPTSHLNPASRNLQVPLIPFQLPMWHLDTQVVSLAPFRQNFCDFFYCKLQDLTEQIKQKFLLSSNLWNSLIRIQPVQTTAWCGVTLSSISSQSCLESLFTLIEDGSRPISREFSPVECRCCTP